MTDYIGAIDVGTNSIHMIIAKVGIVTGRLNIIEKEKEVVRLGSKTLHTGIIDNETIEKTIVVLKKFRQICDSKNAIIRAVGTSAVREAKNSEDFIKRVFLETGIHIEMISGFEEARLVYQGVFFSLPIYRKRILVIDIGGGSTEFLVGEKNNVIYGNSLPLGTIRLTEKFFNEEKITDEEITKCRKYINGIISPIVKAIKNTRYEEVIGTSGTIINILKIVNKTEKNIRDKKTSFTYKEFLNVAKRIYEAKIPREIAKIPEVNEKRADILLAGTLILEQIFKTLEIEQITVSEYALREGIILDTIARMYKSKYSEMLLQLRRKNILNLAKTFNIEEDHAKNTVRLSLFLFDCLRKIHKLGKNEREYLEFAAYLHDIGLSIAHSKHHLHSYYIIKNADLFGFTENEKEIIANICKYHRKNEPKPHQSVFHLLTEEEAEIVKKLVAILRIADGLDRMHSSSIAIKKCKIDKKGIYIYIQSQKKDIDVNIWGAENKKSLFEEVFGLPIYFVIK